MKKLMTVFVMALFAATTVLADCGKCEAKDEAAPAKDAKVGCATDSKCGDAQAACDTAAATKSLFACPMCDSVALAAGKCAKCGMDLAEMKLLGIEDGMAILCACPAACKCGAVKDAKTCACGKEVAKVSLKGMFVASVDDKCFCVSDKPGKAACGVDLVEVTDEAPADEAPVAPAETDKTAEPVAPAK